MVRLHQILITFLIQLVVARCVYNRIEDRKIQNTVFQSPTMLILPHFQWNHCFLLTYFLF
jgi:hypothetical protein